MIRRIAMLSLFAFATTATAATPGDSFVAGNAAAATGAHASAATAFTQTLATRGWSANALFDLGNAYASNGERGRAILAYERALVMSPRDAAVATNLARTREAAGLAAPTTSRIHAELARVSSDEWTWLALAAALFAAAAASAWAWWPRQRGRTGSLAALGTAGAIFGFAAAIMVAPSRGTAVVVRADSARIAPVAGAEEAFAATEGETVQIEQRRPGFVYVRDGDRFGWLPQSALERVLPERAPAHT
ncbi:MAG: tetratricopeptide repeat protein [Kofleriaceae bacterium]